MYMQQRSCCILTSLVDGSCQPILAVVSKWMNLTQEHPVCCKLKQYIYHRVQLECSINCLCVQAQQGNRKSCLDPVIGILAGRMLCYSGMIVRVVVCIACFSLGSYIALHQTQCVYRWYLDVVFCAGPAQLGSFLRNICGSVVTESFHVMNRM